MAGKPRFQDPIRATFWKNPQSPKKNPSFENRVKNSFSTNLELGPSLALMGQQKKKTLFARSSKREKTSRVKLSKRFSAYYDSSRQKSSAVWDPSLRRKMKYEALLEHRCRYLLVPALNHKLEKHPLKYIDTIVYGQLVYCSRNGKCQNITQIARSVGVDRSAASETIKKLIRHGCVEKVGNTYTAVFPTDASTLFTLKTKPKDVWQSQFSYDRTYLPKPESKLTTLQNAIFWRLVALSVPADGGCGHLMIGPGAKVQAISNKYLARGLRCSRKTIAAGLRKLEELGMVKVCPIPKTRRFAVGILPLSKTVSLWRKKVAKTKKTLSFEQVFGQATNAPVAPDPLYRPEIVSFLTEHGVPSKTAEDVTRLVNGYCIPTGRVHQLFREAKKDHERNKEKNPNLPDHPGRLLFREIQRRGEAGEWLEFANIRSDDVTLPELNMQEWLHKHRCESNARKLLQDLYLNKFIHLHSGGQLPVKFYWETAWEIAEHCETFEDFQQKLVDVLFPGEKPESHWLNKWMRCRTIPPPSKWCYKKINLPRHGDPFIKTLHEWAVGNRFDEVEAAEAVNAFVEYVKNEATIEDSGNLKKNMVTVFNVFQEWANAKGSKGLVEKYFVNSVE